MMSNKRKNPQPFPHSGECIKYYRELRGYTQEQLADMIGMSASYFGYVERGRQMASILYLHRLAIALAVPIEALLLPKPHREKIPLRDVLREMIDTFDEEECVIFYELGTKLVPMIRKAQLKD